MNNFLTAFLVGECFLLCFLVYFHPSGENAKANRWLSLFALVLGSAFLGNYLDDVGINGSFTFLKKLINSLQFLLGPGIYIAVLSFVNPTSKFKVRYWLHFLPFLIFTAIDNLLYFGQESISTKELFQIGETAFWVRDILPFQLALYIIQSYRTLTRHEENLRFITAAPQSTDLTWLKLFLLILALPVLFWINDALGILPVLVEMSRSIYAVSIFFLAYFAIKQKSIFPFKERYLEEISEILTGVGKTQTSDNEASTHQRLSSDQVIVLSAQLERLMLNDKIFLDNEINLPTVAERMGLSIHDTSYLINVVTGSNFYTYINHHRVEEAKRLLISSKKDQLNMLGIAFESGFNSKTTFNTAFKKIVGISPSEYAKQHDK